VREKEGGREREIKRKGDAERESTPSSPVREKELEGEREKEGGREM